MSEGNGAAEPTTHGNKGRKPWNKGRHMASRNMTYHKGEKKPKDKRHPLYGRKQSPETIAKRLATLAAKRESKAALGPGTLDAIVYLTHAMQDFERNLEAGKMKRSRAILLVELALRTLSGEK